MSLPRIALTQGDPAGIGPEICLKATLDPLVTEICSPIILGDRRVFESLLAAEPFSALSSRLPTDFWSSSADTERFLHIDSDLGHDFRPGAVNANTGQASYRYIEESIRLALDGAVDAVTTGPVHKEALKMAGVPYPGHTEIYTAKTGSDRSCMMLTSAALSCSFVTTHVGLVDVPALISMPRVLDVIQLSHQAMLRIHNRSPKLVVCGLNPHAGEGGLFGEREEERFIVPAIHAAREQGIDVVGPLPPDTAFLPRRRAQTDCFICMYHDQGHIPLKALAFDEAVNITLGLPIIRTSVDHGTALDIAWQGVADHSSMVEAIKLAVRLCREGIASDEQRRSGAEFTSMKSFEISQ